MTGFRNWANQKPFLVLTNKDTGNHIWYYRKCDHLIIRQMGMNENENTSLYTNKVRNCERDIVKWAKIDMKNGYVVTFDSAELF